MGALLSKLVSQECHFKPTLFSQHTLVAVRNLWHIKWTLTKKIQSFNLFLHPSCYFSLRTHHRGVMQRKLANLTGLAPKHCSNKDATLGPNLWPLWWKIGSLLISQKGNGKSWKSLLSQNNLVTLFYSNTPVRYNCVTCSTCLKTNCQSSHFHATSTFVTLFTLVRFQVHPLMTNLPHSNSSNINEVIRTVLNFLLFFCTHKKAQKKYKKAPKSTKSTKNTKTQPNKSTKRK